MPSGPYFHGGEADDAVNDVAAAAAADVIAADAVADIVVGVIVTAGLVVGVIVTAGLQVVMGPAARIFFLA